MPRTSNPNRKFSGLHFDDPWKEFVSGHKKREEATKDGTKLFKEVYHYRDELFPVRSVPASRPGYVTHDQNFFRIVTKGAKTSELLTEYFAEEHSYRNDSISYSGAHDLAGFFAFVLHGLLVDGVSYAAIEWGEVKFDSKSFILPKSLSLVNPATVKIIDFSKVFAVQKFSWVARFLNNYFEYQDHEFQKDELIVFRHPTLYPRSPVSICIKYLVNLVEGISFSLLQGKANAEPTNHSLSVEIARHKHTNDFFRKESIARVKVKRLFKQPIGEEGVGITSYYDVLAYADYKKHLNLMRDYLISVFDNQLLTQVQSKNEIKSPVKIEYGGFVSNTVIDQALKSYQEGNINVREFVEATKDDFNKKLF